MIAKAMEQLQLRLPFVLYSKPATDEVKALLQHDAGYRREVDSRFVFAPFQQKGDKIHFRPDDSLTSSYQGATLPLAPMDLREEEGKEAYRTVVTAAIDQIRSEDLEKVVLSRRIDGREGPDVFTSFRKALATYPETFVYLVYHPKIGCWLGATPEQFVHIEKGELRTVALAGTLAYNEGESPNWSPKESYEQQVVTDYIVNSLGQQLETISVAPVASVRAGSLWHLKTVINAKLEPQTDLEALIDALHPTPAVCGLPKADAYRFIERYENHDREYYTGYLGELQPTSDIEASLYVNLRCMKHNGNTYSIFVGGGITNESDPDQEWIETQEKSKVMLRLLN